MKKILAILIMLAALLASCDGHNPEARNAAKYCIYVETIRGHEYIIFKGYYSGNIIHSESCPCKKGREEWQSSSMTATASSQRRCTTGTTG